MRRGVTRGHAAEALGLDDQPASERQPQRADGGQVVSASSHGLTRMAACRCLIREPRGEPAFRPPRRRVGVGLLNSGGLSQVRLQRGRRGPYNLARAPWPYLLRPLPGSYGNPVEGASPSLTSRPRPDCLSRTGPLSVRRRAGQGGVVYAHQTMRRLSIYSHSRRAHFADRQEARDRGLSSAASQCGRHSVALCQWRDRSVGQCV